MSVNLSKHRDSLSCAYKDVLNETTETNWALFGYEGQTNDLKVVSKGSQGIEELTEDLNSGKIMYAFVKIDDPRTSLPKFVLINWQGEGANTVRKGICANHLRDVEKFFTGAHVTINARTEEEVEPDLIINKVSKLGFAYNFKAPRSDTTDPTDPVGSNYKRINPYKEINATERDMFWMQEELEEKKRVENERKQKEAERVQREEEVKQRELKEAAQREAKANIRNNQIAQINEAEMTASQNQKLRQVETYTKEVAINPSEILRQQRKQEAQELIAQRTIDARSIFEKHTSAGQIKLTPEKPVRNSLLKAQVQSSEIKPDSVVEQQIVEQQPKIAEDQQSDDESNQFSTIKRSPRDAEKKGEFNNQINHPKEDFQIEGTTSYSNNHNPSRQEVQHITEQQFVDEVIYQDLTEGLGLQARALYDYQAADDTEITFDPGDVITNIDQVDEGWWQGLGPDGTYGLFPANYVELI